MNNLTRFLIASVFSVAVLHAAEPAPAGAAPARKPGEYTHGPDSLPQPGVPKGKLEGPFEFKSQIIAGTVRQYWLYVPAQYDAAKPAGLLVFQDGQRATNPAPDASLRVPQVMENLIHKKDIPVMIGLFITPGNRSETYPPNLGTNNPNNRAQEYDAMNDTYARFLIEEMIPEVKKKYNLSDNVDSRVIGGTSSGAICAFTVAWHRPDQFRKVISAIGSYTSIGYRPATATTPMVPGGDLYPTLIRKNPAKPIRIFLQDGSNDLDNNQGNWFLANQQMVAAFNYANNAGAGRGGRGRQGGAAVPANPAEPAAPAAPAPRYDVKFEWGDGAHSDLHGGVLLPDILRWMFRDYPKE
jgi:enterochelin esterase-like enzyme